MPGPTMHADDPPELNIPLMDHQRHGLAWISWRETQKPPGGILGKTAHCHFSFLCISFRFFYHAADDMGLGKTLTMIALILKTKVELKKSEKKDKGESEEDGWMSKARKNDVFQSRTHVFTPANCMPLTSDLTDLQCKE